MSNRRKEIIFAIVVLCAAIWAGIYQEISFRNYAQTDTSDTIKLSELGDTTFLDTTDTLTHISHISNKDFLDYSKSFYTESHPISFQQNLIIYRENFTNIYVIYQCGDTILIDTLDSIRIKRAKRIRRPIKIKKGGNDGHK